MSRSRKRLADFEARSVQIIAACTLGLAGMSALQATPTHRTSGASPPSVSSHTPAATANSRNVVQRTATASLRRGDKHS